MFRNAGFIGSRRTRTRGVSESAANLYGLTFKRSEGIHLRSVFGLDRVNIDTPIVESNNPTKLSRRQYSADRNLASDLRYHLALEARKV